MHGFPSIFRGGLLALAIVCSGAVAPARATAPASAGPSAQDRGTSGVFAAFLDGNFAISQGKPAAAARDFAAALAVRPDDPVLVRRAFVANLMAGLPGAVPLARNLPDNDAAQMLLAGEAARAGDWAEASRRIAALPTQGPSGLLRPLLLAWTEQGAGRTNAALATLAPLEGSDRFPAVYTLHAALIADLAGRKSDAAQLYIAADRMYAHSDLRAIQIFASFDMRSGQRAVALRRLATLAENDPEMALALPALTREAAHRAVPSVLDGMAEAYLDMAGALRQDGQSNAAILMLRLALALRPDFTPARLLAAAVLEDKHHLTQALAILAAVPATDPFAPVVRLHSADVMARLGRMKAAMETLDALIKEFPTSPLPYAERGDLLRAKGDLTGAIAAYSRAIAMTKSPSASDWPLFFNRGDAYDQTHDWAKAEADLQHALRLSPGQPTVLNYLGYSWADRGVHLAEARRMIEQALHARPDDAAIIDSLGWVMFRQGDIKQAVQLLQRATELAPEDSTINGHLGDAYWAAGRKLEATYQWQRALILNPTPADAVKLRAKLQQGRTAQMLPTGTAARRLQ